MNPQTTIWIYALLGGVLPASIWLLFWLREDERRPEPTWRVILTFLLGMLSVLLVLPFQRKIDLLFPGMGIMAFLLWAVCEEGFKFLAAYFGGIRSKDDNEPLDAMIYMITAALGFVALENTLFIVNPLLQEDISTGIITGNLRFIGASLLHIVASASIGVALALSFYKPLKVKIAVGFIAFLVAVFIHTAFNLFIINQDSLGIFLTFGMVWTGITMLIYFFERVKSIAHRTKHTI